MRDPRTDSAELGETQLATPTDPHAATASAAPSRIGRFRVTGLLGEGGMGAVYAAEDEVLGRQVAVKLLHAHTGNAEARSLAEARALARLAHPNVVAIHEVGTHDGAVYVAMELIAGASLRRWLETPRPWRDRLAVLIQAGRGLAAAHAAGLVHRDFKPDNVLVGDDGRVRVLDFGLAIDEQLASGAGGADSQDGAAVSGRLTREGALVGTPLYMAPEQWVADATDPRTDQFALCLVLYEALYGQRAFDGATIGQLRGAVLAGGLREPPSGDVPVGIRAAIVRGLAVEPDARHASIDALLDALLAAARPRRGRIIAAGVALALAATVGVAVALRPGEEPPPPPSQVERILAASDLPAVVPSPLPGDPMQVTVDRLSNGLTVYISPDRSKPRIHAAVVLRTGSLRDPPGMTGLGHMFGHLLSKGSHRVGTADFAAEEPHLDRIRALYRDLADAPTRRAELLAAIDAENVAAGRHVIHNESNAAMSALGATSINTTSDRDWTLSSAALPSNRLDAWAELEADRWMNTVFRQYYAEVGAVLEEMRGGLPGMRQVDEAIAAAFPGHPYGHNPIGSPADVQAQHYLALEAFYAGWSVPNNAAIVLVGDVDRERALPILERAFGGWQPRALPDGEPPAPAPLTAPVALRLPSSGERSAIVMWQLPAAGHPDRAALTIAGRLLDDPQAGLLEAEIASGELALVGIGTTFHRAAGMFIIALTPGADRTPDATIEVVDVALARLARGEISQDAIDAIARDLALEPPGRDVAANRRGRIAESFATGEPWAEVAAWSQRLAAVRPADIARVVSTHLGANRVTAVIEPGAIEPIEIERPTISPITFSEQVHSPWVSDLLATDVVPIEPRFVWAGRDYTRTDSAAGPVITVPNPRDDGFWLRLDYELGDHQLPGLCAALDADQASDDPDAEARRQTWHRLGVTVAIECEATYAAIELSGRDGALDDAWRALDAWLRAPAPSASDLAKRLRQYREQLAQITAEPAWRWRATLVLATLGPSHPWLAQMRDGARPSLTAADLTAATTTLRGAPRATLYFGPRPAAELAALVGDRDASITSPPRFVGATLRPSRPRVVVLDERGQDTTQVQLVFPLATLTGARTLDAELLETYLQGDGLSNPLNTALRAQRGLVYSSAFQVVQGARSDEPSDLLLWLAAAPENVATAIDLALPLVRDAVVDPARVARARDALDARYRADWRTGRNLARAVMAWSRAGHDGDPRLERFGRIHALDTADVAALLAEVAAAPMIIAIAGDASKLDLARLRDLGEVTVVTAADLSARTGRR